MDLAIIERTLAVIFGLVVLVTALWALKLDWKSQGLENIVFKFMLALLALGALLGTLAGIGIVGKA
jgi:hypothetical protein